MHVAGRITSLPLTVPLFATERLLDPLSLLFLATTHHSASQRSSTHARVPHVLRAHLIQPALSVHPTRHGRTQHSAEWVSIHSMTTMQRTGTLVTLGFEKCCRIDLFIAVHVDELPRSIRLHLPTKQFMRNILAFVWAFARC